MAGKKSVGSKANALASYPMRYEENRRKRLERHLKKHPNDIEGQKRLEKGEFPYRRKKPFSRIWKGKTRIAHIFKVFGRSGHEVLDKAKYVDIMTNSKSRGKYDDSSSKKKKENKNTVKKLKIRKED